MNTFTRTNTHTNTKIALNKRITYNITYNNRNSWMNDFLCLSFWIKEKYYYIQYD